MLDLWTKNNDDNTEGMAMHAPDLKVHTCVTNILKYRLLARVSDFRDFESYR